MSDSIGNAIISARTPPAPEQVADAIIKQLFRNDLNAGARLVARCSIGAALAKWKDQLLADAAEKLDDAKRAARDSMMLADELRLKVELHERGLAVKPVT